MSQGSTSGAQQGPFSNPYQSPYQLPGATSWTNQGTTAQVQGTPFGNPPSDPPQQLAGTFPNGPGGNGGAAGIPYTTGDQGGLTQLLQASQDWLNNQPKPTGIDVDPGLYGSMLNGSMPTQNGPGGNAGATGIPYTIGASWSTGDQGGLSGDPPSQQGGQPGPAPGNLPPLAQPGPRPTLPTTGQFPNPGIFQQTPQPVMNQPQPGSNPFRNSMVQPGQLSGRVPQPGQVGGRVPQPARVQNQPQQVRTAPGVAKPNPFLRTR